MCRECLCLQQCRNGSWSVSAGAQHFTSLQSLNLLQQLGYACLNKTLLLLMEKICTKGAHSAGLVCQRLQQEQQ